MTTKELTLLRQAEDCKRQWTYHPSADDAHGVAQPEFWTNEDGDLRWEDPCKPS